MARRRRRVRRRKSRNMRALRARGVRAQKRHRFHRCDNRSIRHAINASWDPTQRAEALAFLRKCFCSIKPSQVGRRGGITRSNYVTMARKLGRARS